MLNEDAYLYRNILVLLDDNRINVLVSGVKRLDVRLPLRVVEVLFIGDLLGRARRLRSRQ